MTFSDLFKVTIIQPRAAPGFLMCGGSVGGKGKGLGGGNRNSMLMNLKKSKKLK